MANHLQKITQRAKQIRKAYPKKAWTECIKAASRELKKAGKLGATLVLEKKETRKTPVKRIVRVTRNSNGTYAGAKTVKVSGIVSKAVKMRGGAGLRAKADKMRGGTGLRAKADKMKLGGLAGVGGGNISATAQINLLKSAVARIEAKIKAGGRSMPVKEKNELKKALKVYKSNITNYKKLL